MPFATAPDTDAIGAAIVSYLSALAYPDTTLVYQLAQQEGIKDVTDRVANGGVCVEVYGDMDTSERRGFGGRIWDTSTWFILSMCSLDNPTYARQIYKARDQLVQPFQQHAQMSNIVSNLFQSQLLPNMKFFRIQRNDQWLRAHLAILEVKCEWVVQGGIIS